MAYQTNLLHDELQANCVELVALSPLPIPSTRMTHQLPVGVAEGCWNRQSQVGHFPLSIDTAVKINAMAATKKNKMRTKPAAPP